MGNPQLKNNAQKHFESFAVKYKEQIIAAINDTVIMRLSENPIEQGKIDDISKSSGTKTDILIYQTDTVSALYSEAALNREAVILNFASYKHPGGGFLNGTMAQEEALCSESNLCNILTGLDSEFYEQHRKDTNNNLYRSELLYTPNVIFSRTDRIKKCNVITCAAPNALAALKHSNITKQDVDNAMRERIEYILYSAAALSSRQMLILGAFGCGVFGNETAATAEKFRELLYGRYANVFGTVIFAIPDKGKYDIFSDVFKQ